jgi:hypothetical protein
MARYGPAASRSVERAMHKRKHGTLESGRSHQPVKSRAQAIAIGLSEAREKGARVPSRSSGSSSKRGHGSSSSSSSSRSSGRSRRSSSSRGRRSSRSR